ncbi:related to thioesterase [Ustilago trichophora]|uniref:Related to thioesterase n=1 Tax=Ustilago trichophora TaxID=86804 RepID=A0A5C3DTL8_9BASI|nr:related to thioesterase [Ustilago trichophora]
MAEAKGPWPHTVTYQTRWLDNDQYGHLNNSSYYLIADSIINAYLIDRCGIQPFIHPSSSSSSTSTTTSSAPSGEKDVKEVVGLVISNSCRYFASCSFPSPLKVGLRVVKLGRSSVTYQVSIGEEAAKKAEETAALITSTHVFVDRVTRRPVSMPTKLKDPLAKLLVDVDSQESRSKL